MTAVCALAPCYVVGQVAGTAHLDESEPSKVRTRLLRRRCVRVSMPLRPAASSAPRRRTRTSPSPARCAPVLNRRCWNLVTKSLAVQRSALFTSALLTNIGFPPQ